MGDVIQLAERLRALLGADESNYEEFLLDEGLELIAAYRSIEDADMRKSLRQLVEMIAQHQGKSRHTPPSQNEPL